MITVVTGLPRSGTSLAMQLLEAAGIPPYTDGVRRADAANPRGYYEAEVVKQLPGHSAWLEEVEGKAVKVIHQLLPALPPGFPYQVLVMQRSLPAVLDSQRRLLTQLGRSGTALSSERLAMVFEAQLQTMDRWLAALPGERVLRLPHGTVLNAPQASARRLLDWLGEEATADRVARIAAVVEPGLSRAADQQAPGCGWPLL
jgi:hypothetical protein